MSTDKTPLNNWEPKFELKFPEKKIKLIINNHLKLKPINSTLNHSYSLANLPINMNDMVYVKSPNAKNIENLEPSSNRIPRVSGKNLPDVFTSPTSAGLKLKGMLGSQQSFLRREAPTEIDINLKDQFSMIRLKAKAYLTPSAKLSMDLSPSFFTPISNRIEPINVQPDVASFQAKLDELNMNSSKSRLGEDFSKLNQTLANTENSAEVSIIQNLHQFHLKRGLKARLRDKEATSLAKQLRDRSKESPENRLRKNLSYQDLKSSKLFQPPDISKNFLNEMITIKKIRTPEGKSIVKKMLHVPTFKIYDLSIEPIPDITSFEKNYIKKTLQSWKSFDYKSSKLAKLYDFYWDSPEGSITVIHEASKYGYLSEYLENCGSFPESTIQIVAKQILEGIDEIHSKLEKTHGNINSSTIFIDETKRVKLSVGKINQIKKTTNQKLMKESKEILDSSKIYEDNHNLIPCAQDIYDFGMLILNMAIGDLTNIEVPTPENFKMTLTSPKRNVNCCILHTQNQSNNNNSTSNLQITRQKITSNKIKLHIRQQEGSCERNSSKNPPQSDQKCPTLFSMLTKSNRFSETFIDFLCCCLKFDPIRRGSAKTLLSHKFFSDKHQPSGPLLSFTEIISMARKIPETTETKVNDNLKNLLTVKLCDTLQMALMDDDLKAKFDLTMRSNSLGGIYDKRILDIANELEIMPVNLWKKVSKIIYK